MPTDKQVFTVVVDAVEEYILVVVSKDRPDALVIWPFSIPGSSHARSMGGPIFDSNLSPHSLDKLQKNTNLYFHCAQSI